MKSIGLLAFYFTLLLGEIKMGSAFYAACDFFEIASDDKQRKMKWKRVSMILSNTKKKELWI